MLVGFITHQYLTYGVVLSGDARSGGVEFGIAGFHHPSISSLGKVLFRKVRYDRVQSGRVGSGVV